MERDSGAALRRTLFAVALGLFAVIAGWNLSSLGTILARPEPHRSLRLAVAASSLALGGGALVLLVADLRGSRIPRSVSLMPAWIVFGLDLVDSYYFTNRPLFLVTGLAALGMGMAGIVLFVRAVRRRTVP